MGCGSARFPLLLSSYEGNPLSFRKSSFLHAHLSASAIPCTKLLQSSAILKIRNHTGKFTKLQELERKSPRFRCFSDFPRSCRFCFVSKISKPQQETHYMVIPCTKLLQSSAILKIRNHTGKFTKLQELERKSPRFRCFSDFPRSCRFCFVSKISKPQQETHYMVWPTLINGRAGAER